MGSPIIFNGNAAKLLKPNLIVPAPSGTNAMTIATQAMASNLTLTLPGAISAGNLYSAANGVLSMINPGSGAGITNLFLDNAGFEVGTSGYSAYFNTPGPAPVTGTGGVPSGTTITRTTTTPLFGSASGLISKDAVSRQGEGIAYLTSVPLFMRGAQATLTFDYAIASGTYATGDIGIYFVDLTNSVVIQPTGYQLVSTGLGTNMAVANVQIPYNCLSLNVCWHVASTSALAYSVKLDNIILSKQTQSIGSVDTDWVSYTPTGSWTTNSTYTGSWRRVGDSMELSARVDVSGAPTATTLSINLPTGYTIDTTKATTASSLQAIGSANALCAGNVYVLTPNMNSSTSIKFNVNGSGTGVTATSPGTFAAANYVTMQVNVPIVGWSSNNVTSDQTASQVVDYYGIASTTTSVTATAADVPLSTSIDATGTYSGSTYTVAVAGDYDVSGMVSVATTTLTTGGVLEVIYVVNGTAYVAGRIIGNGVANDFIATGATKTYRLKAGDTVKLQARSSTTTTINATLANTSLAIARKAGPNQITAADTVAARAYASSTTVSATLATIVYTTVDFLTGGTYSAGVWTCPAPGKYQVNVGLQIGGTVVLNSIIQMQVLKNGAAFSEHESYAGGGMNAQDAQISDVLNLKAGDTVSVVARSTAGAPTISASNSKNFLSIIRVGAFN